MDLSTAAHYRPRDVERSRRLEHTHEEPNAMNRTHCALAILGGLALLSACGRVDHYTARPTQAPTMTIEPTQALRHAAPTIDVAPLVLPELDAAAADVLTRGRYETATFALG
jgi:hypothetical protein